MISRFSLLALMPFAVPAAILFAFPVAAQPGWISDTRTGCQVWNQNPDPSPNTAITWSGACAEGTAQGHGTLQWFVDGKPDQRYEGKFRGGQANGRGVLSFTNGARYEGEFRDGRFNGRGVYAYADRGRHVGEYRDGKAHGRGVYSWADGGRYEGEFSDGKRNGRGVFTSAEGHCYEGEYRDNKPNGAGTFKLADGQVFSGTWSNGCLDHGDGWAAIGVTKEQCGFE